MPKIGFLMVKMLTIDQVIEVYQNGVEIKYRRKKHHYNLKGEYDPGLREVNVYLPSIDSSKDKDITLLHELIHARNDLKSAKQPDIEDSVVEEEALKTYQKKYYVLQFIKLIYAIE